MSPAPDSTLDDPQKIIADLQRQLAESNAERDEALEQQTATAEVLGVINSSPGDLAPVFDAILHKAVMLCEAAFGVLLTCEAEQFHAVALHNVPQRFAELMREPFRSRGPESATGRLVQGENVVLFADIAAHPAYAPETPGHKFVQSSGARSHLAVALRKDGVLHGAVIIYRTEVRPFTDKQIALLQNFAAQAVIAMENARLITETREALEQQTATAEVLGVINSSPGNLTPVFDAILEKAHALCGASTGSLQLFDGEFIRAVATRGLPDEFANELRKARRSAFRDASLRDAPFVQITDIADPALTGGDTTFLTAHGVTGVRTHLRVPLRKDDALLGFIVAGRREVRPFSQQEISLIQNFAAQAVIAMENARLITETREALEQQTATAEVLQVINSSPGDLAPVFDAMLEKATWLCDAACGVLRIWDGEHFHIGTVHGEPRFSDWLRQRGPSRPPADDPLGRIIKGEGVVHFADAPDDAGYMASPGFRQAVDLSGMRSGITVPLRKDDVLLGAITVYRQEVRPFSDKQVALLQNFAAQAVIAMENARLITETREALEQQTATAEVLGVINSSPGDLAPVFDAMLEKTLRLCEAAHGNFLTYDGEVFHGAAFRGEPQFTEYRRQQGPLRPDAGGQLARMVQGGGTLHRIDAREGEAYRDDPGFRRMVDGLGIRTSLTVPLRKGDALLGAVRAYRLEVRPFTDKQIALVENFAAQAVIAMENARLIIETREALEQQTATAEILGVINSSPGDLAPVFEAILEKAHTLCDAATGSLRIIDGDMIRAVAFRGQSGEFADQVQQGYPFASAPLLASLRDGAPFVHISDVAERDDPISRLSTASGNRTILAVPLRKDDALLGMIVAGRKEVRLFTDKQIGLLRNFAAQAVIAMENARLITETREALDQQTATAEVLGVINSSPGELGPVFDAMLDRATSLCEAAFGVLWIIEGERIRAVATHNVPSSYRHFLEKETASSPGPSSGVAQTIRAKSPILFADAAAGDAYRSGDPFAVAAVELGGVRTLLNAPLVKDDAVLGILAVYRQEVRPFTDKQISLLENFAAQAVIAIENARLITETREALEQQTATAEVLGVINSSPSDLTPVFNAILEKAHGLCGITFGTLQLYDGEKLRAVATRGFPEAQEKVIREPYAPERNSPLQGLIDGGRFVQFPDLAKRDTQVPNPRSRIAVELGIRTLLFLPLRKDNLLLGLISAARTEAKPFSEREIALLENFAAQAVIALENARLLGELRQRTDEVAELNRGLEARVAEQVDELGRVGRLKRFLAPQLAELIVSQGAEKILESHRREIVVVFCDLRGYTAFTETAEPEEVLEFLRQYHGALGPLVSQFEGTLDQFSGDGIMVFFNDPVPCPDPAERAVKMSVAMREAAGTLIAAWRRRGRMLGFGAGIAQGYATLGQIGFADRSGYTAIGTVCNLAARLCAEAKDGQILVGQRVAVAVEETVPLEEVGELTLKGLTQPVVAYNVPLGAIQPAFRVIEGGSPETV